MADKNLQLTANALHNKNLIISHTTRQEKVEIQILKDGYYWTYIILLRHELKVKCKSS